MRRSALAVLAAAGLFAGACGDDTDRGSPRQPTPTPIPAPQPPPPNPTPSLDAATPALVPLPPPLTTQLASRVPAVQFLGWSQDGRRFVVRATHGYDMEELGGQNLLALFQVHDAMTGAMVESMQVERIADDSVAADDPLSKAWSEAQPSTQWKAFRAENPLVGRDSATSHGDWTIETESMDKPPHASTLEVTASEAGIETRWDNFDEARLQGPERAPAQAPRLRILARRGDVTHHLITVRAPWSYGDVNESRDQDDPYVTGAVRIYWSPSGDRVALVVAHRIHGAHEEHGEMADSRWYVRALGPQIKVVDGGAGATAAHLAAARLAAAGLPITVIETSKQPAKTTAVYFRGSAQDLAQRAAKHLGIESAVEKLDTRGWSTVVVVLAR